MRWIDRKVRIAKTDAGLMEANYKIPVQGETDSIGIPVKITNVLITQHPAKHRIF